MPSEKLASGENLLKGELAAAWNILEGSSGDYTDLGIARRFGGSSAAYSLRDIGAMNGSVVRVRREPEDTTAAIDDEENFSANQVQSGTLEDWVNGKLESTLPADVDTAAATYSLRKAKADYSSDAVRIRRSSDDVEVNVALDSDDKVSANSEISTVSGSTSATDLNGFLNETLTVGTAENGTGGFSNYTLTNVSDTGFSADNSAGGTGSAGFPYKHNTGDVIVVRFTVSNFNSTSSLSPVLRGTDSLGSVVGTTSGGNEILANGTYTETHTASAEGIYLMFADGNTGSYTISDFQIVSHTHQAFVHTWYDQAGSNNAIQATDSKQPKIAESGALLADGLDFDGINDELETGATITGSTINGFVVANLDGTDGKSLYSVGNTKPNILFGDPSLAYVTNGGTALSGGTAPTLTDTLFSSLFISGGTSKGFINAVEVSSGDAGSNSASADKLTIGNLESGDRFMNGSMKELILYTSDQSANRFKIESNINNYYGLYNDANDLTQTEWQNTGAESFSSTSIDGFSYSNSDSTSFIGVTLSETLPLNDSVFVSFNASGVTHPDSSDQSPQIRLRDSISGGSATSDINQVTNGFNAYTLTYNTGSSGQHIVFSEGDTAGGTVTISDFKVSRIARNGFVETWYDQSGNGNDAVQTSASNQPAIVQNGGLNSDGVSFDGVNDYMDFTTDLTAPFWSFIAHRATKNNSAVFGVTASYDIWLGRRSTGTYIQVVTSVLSGGSYTDSIVLRTDKVNPDGAEIFSNGTSLASGDNATVNIGSWGRLGSQGQLDTNKFLGGNIKEAVFYTTDKTSDRTEIETEINNHYNIF